MRIIATTTELRTALNEGVVLFEFVKKDGTLRHARGTRCRDLIPTNDVPKGKRPPQVQALYDRQTVAFYDIDKKSWRSMQLAALWSAQRAMKLV